MLADETDPNPRAGTSSGHWFARTVKGQALRGRPVAAAIPCVKNRPKRLGDGQGGGRGLGSEKRQRMELPPDHVAHPKVQVVAGLVIECPKKVRHNLSDA
jgi:hypothetical protein